MKGDTHLTVVVSSANQAMVDCPADECCRILETVADVIRENENEAVSEILRDTNGNRVGHFYFSPAEEPDDEGV